MGLYRILKEESGGLTPPQHLGGTRLLEGILEVMEQVGQLLC